MKDYFVHESSYIDDGVKIGKETKIWHFCHVQTGAVIGEKCSFGQNVNVSNNVKIGNGCKLQNNVSVYEGVEMKTMFSAGRLWCLPMTSLQEQNIPRAAPDIRRLC